MHRDDIICLLWVVSESFVIISLLLPVAYSCATFVYFYRCLYDQNDNFDDYEQFYYYHKYKHMYTCGVSR